MSMTVNISGTFSEKQRPNNGLERVAQFMDTHRIAQIPVVAVVEWHSHQETKTGTKMAVSIVAVEPGFEADGSDPTGIGGQLRQLLDELRKRNGLASVEDTLFSAPRESYDFDGDGGPELDGQEALPIRMGPDGEHQVPEASAEELMAERAEVAKSSVVEATAALAAKDAAAGVPAAEFSGGNR
ncbi:hypothetical protein [Actinoplanes siamensis]|uniref:Uncharacterized protein n=1 Tax=Actinoplanes siamensis TaxID=1223317 RepID=A0A919ND59_9ACTN|nr:hypothetical protein [Actinoplanes siamensis]GIF08701.1 hypothetical protein Asi03nite_62390 [Actinoplanes siamensis]